MTGTNVGATSTRGFTISYYFQFLRQTHPLAFTAGHLRRERCRTPTFSEKAYWPDLILARSWSCRKAHDTEHTTTLPTPHPLTSSPSTPHSSPPHSSPSTPHSSPSTHHLLTPSLPHPPPLTSSLLTLHPSPPTPHPPPLTTHPPPLTSHPSPSTPHYPPLTSSPFTPHLVTPHSPPPTHHSLLTLT